MHSKDKRANQVEGGGCGTVGAEGGWGGKHMSTSTHFKSLSLICEEPENLETKW